ncbi:MAG TPA: hypothetical protein VKA49_18015 [Flavitalea sp.]|nr:hypothetical protein [Flavitalea sp.]
MNQAVFKFLMPSLVYDFLTLFFVTSLFPDSRKHLQIQEPGAQRIILFVTSLRLLSIRFERKELKMTVPIAKALHQPRGLNGQDADESG